MRMVDKSKEGSEIYLPEWKFTRNNNWKLESSIRKGLTTRCQTFNGTLLRTSHRSRKILSVKNNAISWVVSV